MTKELLTRAANLNHFLFKDKEGNESAIRGLSKRQIELIKAIQIDSIRAKMERKIAYLYSKKALSFEYV